MKALAGGGWCCRKLEKSRGEEQRRRLEKVCLVLPIIIAVCGSIELVDGCRAMHGWVDRSGSLVRQADSVR